jgi:hypothetical protein
VLPGFVSAVLVVGMLFEGWPAAMLPPAQGHALAQGPTAVVAAAVNRAVAAYADRGALAP